MTTIGEAYVHLRPYDVDKLGITELGERAVLVAAAAFKETYSFDGTIEVHIERGSAKVWITLLGAFSWSLYDGVSKYPDFKAGVEQMVQDARDFGSLFNRAFITQAEAQPDQVHRTERRTKTPGKVKRGLDKLETASADDDVKAAMAILRSALADLNEKDEATLEEVLQTIYPEAAQALPPPEKEVPILYMERLPPSGFSSFSKVVHTSEYSTQSLPRILLEKPLSSTRLKQLL